MPVSLVVQGCYKGAEEEAYVLGIEVLVNSISLGGLEVSAIRPVGDLVDC